MRQSYLNRNLLTQGMSSRCRELQAACAFFWFAFALFAVNIAVNFMGGSGTSMRRRGGGAPRTAPTMSQV